MPDRSQPESAAEHTVAGRALSSENPLTPPRNAGRCDLLPFAIQNWSLTGLQQRLFTTGGRLIPHARYFILPVAESCLTGRLFWQILGRIERRAWHPT
jgi:hypothetical protein